MNSYSEQDTAGASDSDLSDDLPASESYNCQLPSEDSSDSDPPLPSDEEDSDDPPLPSGNYICRYLEIYFYSDL